LRAPVHGDLGFRLEVAEWAVARPICGSSGFRRDDSHLFG